MRRAGWLRSLTLGEGRAFGVPEHGTGPSRAPSPSPRVCPGPAAVPEPFDWVDHRWRPVPAQIGDDAPWPERSIDPTDPDFAATSVCFERLVKATDGLR